MKREIAALSMHELRVTSVYTGSIGDFRYRFHMEFDSDEVEVATYTKCPDGSYDVILKIIEPTKTTLEVRLNVMTRSIAKYIERTWQDKAPSVYSKISDTLID